MILGNRTMRKLVEIGYDINELLEEVDRLIEDMNTLSAELKLMVALVERL